MRSVPVRLLLASSVALGVLALGCAGVAPMGGKLPDARSVQPTAEVIQERSDVAAAGVGTDELKSSYVAAGSPTLGFIRDRYQLPIANPLGAARLIEGNTFGLPFQQAVTAPSTERPFSIEPMRDGFAVQQLALLQEDLAKAGVRVVEVTTADANRIVDAEKRAAQDNSRVQWNEMTPSGAQVLVSYQESFALGGPIYIVRVIRTADGALLALRTGPAQGGAVALRPLLGRAIADGLQAAANHPLR